MSNERAVWSVPQLPPDDIYTEYDDIAAEVSKYEAHFKGKVVLCNCDDPVESNFFRYFAVNFNRLQLAKLIVVAKENSSIACRDFAFYAPHSRYYRSAYCLEINKLYDLAGEDPVKDILEQLPNRINPYIPLTDDGDFRTYKNIDIMRRADILATHPPCSLFEDYITLAINYRKQFLLIGNRNINFSNNNLAAMNRQEPPIRITPMQSNGRFYRTAAHVPGGRIAVDVPQAAWFTNFPQQSVEAISKLLKNF